MRIIIEKYRVRFYTSIINICISFRALFPLRLKTFDINSLDIDNTVLYKRISVPKYTWSWVSVTEKTEAKNVEDCGLLCSRSDNLFNTLQFDETNSTCFLTYVSREVVKTISIKMYLFQMNCSHEDKFSETVQVYADIQMEQSILTKSCCKVLMLSEKKLVNTFQIFQ